VRVAQKLLGAPTTGGGSAWAGGGGGRSQRSQIRPHATRNAQKWQKMGSFLHFLAYKSPKTLFFAQKYLTRYTPETFFEEYINSKIFSYFRHCRVIPVQRFGSHIRPRLPGLGLRWYISISDRFPSFWLSLNSF
jgi:hypothetical protein